MTTPTPTAKVTAQSRLRELLPTNKQQRVAIDGACDAIDSLERELAAANEQIASLKRGEYICRSCGLRKNGEHDAPPSF